MSKPIDQQLLPCGCGSRDNSIGYESPQRYWVECGDCGYKTDCESRRCLAIHVWNTRAAVQPAGVAVPEGWKLVPAAVTGRIVLAMERNGVPDGTDAEMLWDAMLAAAPHPVSGEQEPTGGESQ